MNKKIILLIMIAALVATTGCSKNYEFNESTEAKESMLFSEYKYDNNKAQLHSVVNTAISENGYYLVINGMLYFYDVSTGFSSPCCYDANCKHTNEKCSAFLEDKKQKDQSLKTVAECYGDTVFYYENKIYMIENNKHGEYYLNQYNAQFGDKVRIAVIEDNKEVETTTYLRNSQVFKVKDGYLYYISYTFDPKNVKPDELVKVTNNCMRIKLAKDSKPEKLGEFDALPYGDGLGLPGGFKILFDDEAVYYISGGEVSRFAEASEYKIARYNADNGTFEMVFEYSGKDGDGAFGSGMPAPDGIDENCYIDNNSNFYFVSENGKQIIQYSLDNKAGKCFYSSSNMINSIAMDGEYIFVTEYVLSGGESYIVVLNNNGEIVQSIKMDYDEEFLNMLKMQNRDASNMTMRVSIMCVDDRYIILTTKDGYLKGLHGNINVMNPTLTIGTAVVKKSDILNGKIDDIKQIYKAQ